MLIMPKQKRRKQPIVRELNVPMSSVNCRKVIRRFHVLLKRRSQLRNATVGISASSTHAQELAEIEGEIVRLGGLERYQWISVLGQKEERGGGSEKIFIDWMKELGVNDRSPTKLRLLEVGALRADNYSSCATWIDCTPLDLHSRHPQIMERDFLTLDIDEHENKWNAISLSLVVNFVPMPADRGKMLKMSHAFLCPGGVLFLALPLPCVANSRYLTCEQLKALMESLGFSQIRERWRQNGKMAYWLYQKSCEPLPKSSFTKKMVLRRGNRNNFAIILDHDDDAR